jgi:uncharacterized membrane protein
VTFPNAPYILTDLVHLLRGPVFRWWFDVGLICSFALTGCFSARVAANGAYDGSHALRRAHRLAEHRDLHTLGGFGVYLGRFLRFNSWDVLTEPWRVFRAIAVRIFDPLNHSQAYGVTMMFAALLLACYVVFISAGTAQEGQDISMKVSVRLRLTARRAGLKIKLLQGTARL